jgi:hypothetical protein
MTPAAWRAATTQIHHEQVQQRFELMRTVHQGERQVILEGPGFFQVQVSALCPRPLAVDDIPRSVTVTARMRPTGTDTTLRAIATLHSQRRVCAVVGGRPPVTLTYPLLVLVFARPAAVSSAGRATLTRCAASLTGSTWVGCAHPGFERQCDHCGNTWTSHQ